MNRTKLLDRMHWGLNRTARKLGAPADAYRPNNWANPLAHANRYLRLPVVFIEAGGEFTRANGFGKAVWCAYLDASYTKPGDYVVQQGQVWFIASQASFGPVLCVKANRFVSVLRSPPPVAGRNSEMGSAVALVNVLSNWPASVLASERGGRPSAALPADVNSVQWTVLLPNSHGRTIQTSDFVQDELGRRGVVVSSEQSDLGWRLSVGQLST